MASKIYVNRFNLTCLLRYIHPRNIYIYQDVFVHRSVIKQLQKQYDTDTEKNEIKSNERLEFLGDAILNVIVTDYLYDRFPNENEGFLTKLRIKIVKGPTLAMFAEKVGIKEHLMISTSTTINDHILENAFEALIGAIYLDYRVIGLELLFTKLFVFGILREFIDWDHFQTDDNYKDVLMRHSQKMHLSMPVYNVVSISGQAHCPLYKVSVTVTDEHGNTHTAVEENSTKRNAEQACAKHILTCMNMSDTIINGRNEK